MSEYSKMINERLYKCMGDEITALHKKKCDLLDKFNSSSYSDFYTKKEVIKELFKSTGKNFMILKPFYCDYGAHISIGENFFANADCLMLDVCDITIGDNVMLAPRVSIYTAAHPIDKDVRNSGLEYGKKVKIGNDVWIGGSVTILPGVTIGDNVVIGAGSVVVNDIPSDSVAVGNPCRVIRKITEDDKLYWEEEAKKYYENI